ncbi:MAG: molybdopterin-dependent oxidoreductase, partial [Chloroflexi bacterium]|nr:molybdopterin-dependent oxidoreductase [Chloroflexota bacterium]
MTEVPVRPVPAGRQRAAAALAGIAAGAVGLAVSELAAGLVPGVPSLVVAVGSLVIALQPPGAKELVAGLFGTADKIVLNLAVVAVALAIAAMAGIVGRARLAAAGAIYAACAGLGAGAAVVLGQAPAWGALAGAALSAVAATAVLRELLVMAGLRDVVEPWRTAVPGTTPPSPGRRRFLLASGLAMVAAVLGGGVGRWLLAGRPAAVIPPGTALPAPAAPLPSLAPGASLAAAGITPLVTPAASFFTIDTALIPPGVDLATWRLRVTGLVEREVSFGYEDLLAMPLVETWTTLACVSNEVGGDLVGNASWSGVPVVRLLEAAGVRPGATQIVGRAVDGFTAGFPTAWALEPTREP